MIGLLIGIASVVTVGWLLDRFLDRRDDEERLVEEIEQYLHEEHEESS